MKLELTYTFDSEEELRAHLAEPAAPATSAEPAAPAASDTRDDNYPSKDDVDADGMPYDPDVHADPAQFTKDGKWRAQRGKAEEAKKARADFLAGGGNVTPPADIPSEPPVAAPAMPGVPPVAAPAMPVTMEMVAERATEVLQAGKIEQDAIANFYAESVGVPVTELSAKLTEDEQARAKLYADLGAL